jgi:hypothetical protein
MVDNNNGLGVRGFVSVELAVGVEVGMARVEVGLDWKRSNNALRSGPRPDAPFTPYYHYRNASARPGAPLSAPAASAAGAPHSTSQTSGPGCMQTARRQKNVDRLEKHAGRRLRCHPFIRPDSPSADTRHTSVHLSRLGFAAGVCWPPPRSESSPAFVYLVPPWHMRALNRLLYPANALTVAVLRQRHP